MGVDRKMEVFLPIIFLSCRRCTETPHQEPQENRLNNSLRNTNPHLSALMDD